MILGDRVRLISPGFCYHFDKGDVGTIVEIDRNDNTAKIRLEGTNYWGWAEEDALEYYPLNYNNMDDILTLMTNDGK